MYGISSGRDDQFFTSLVQLKGSYKKNKAGYVMHLDNEGGMMLVVIAAEEELWLELPE